MVRTAALPGQVVLTVEDGGGDVDPERLNQLFEPCAPGREGTNGLEMAACKTIVRRLQGRIQADPRPGGGVTVTVELPAGSG